MTHVDSREREYWIEPAILEGIRESLIGSIALSNSFADVCASMAPRIASEVEVHGLDNVPAKGPVIVIKNHPCHFDTFVLGSLFRVRQDIHLLAKSSPLTEPLPQANAIFLRKNGVHANRHDIKKMRTYLQVGGSLLATPWGCMDHQIASCATLERSIQNVTKFASLGRAAILPIYIDAVWDENRQLPLDSAAVTIHEAIIATEDGLDMERITTQVGDMYKRSTGLKC